MSRSDYIIRQIEQFSTLLSAILGLKREQKPQLVEIAIDEHLKRIYGLSLRLLRSLPEREIVRMCETGDLSGKEKLYVLGMTLKEDAELQELQGRGDDGLALRLKALGLLLVHTERDDAGDGPRLASEPIAELLEALRAYELPAETSMLVWRHHARCGRYADAENELFELLARMRASGDARSEALASEGVAFYERLLTLDDSALIDGNLPRAEVVEGLRELRRST